jgi:hypothetical protein
MRSWHSGMLRRVGTNANAITSAIEAMVNFVPNKKNLLQ